MKYIYIDGDDIGLRIEKSLIANDVRGLNAINQAVNEAISRLTDYLASQNCQIIFSGADGIIFNTEDPHIKEIQSYISTIEKSITFSIGVGNSLREAFLALRHAKANGKNGVMILDGDFIWVDNSCRNKMAEQASAPDCHSAALHGNR